MRRALAVVGLLAGCVTDQLAPCGDLLCPVGNVCLSNGCASPDAIAACTGLEIGAVCAGGVCEDAGGTRVCRPRVCGDNLRVIGEACDDGNQQAGDGCSADCLSLEVCGNEYVDLFGGDRASLDDDEQCDSGAFGLANDGCSSTCLLEFPAWRDVSATLPSARQAMSIAYDVARDRLVMFGGNDGSPANDTWELELASPRSYWRRGSPTMVPQRRARHGMAYDSTRKVTVMFGGDGFTGTFAWDGIDWTTLAMAVHPEPARADPALAYDPIRDRVVLFGGSALGTSQGDTWLWDGTTWTEATSAVAPPPGAHAMSWAGDRIVLVAITSTMSMETWEWNGAAWSLRTSAFPLGPAPRSPRIAWLGGDDVLLYDGFSTWSWDGATGGWSDTSSTPCTINRDFAMTALAPGKVIAFGGVDGAMTRTNQAWTWTAAGHWTRVDVDPIEPLKQLPTMAYQRARGTTVLYGSDQTWEWDGSVWRVLSGTQPTPSGRVRHAMTAAGDRVWMYGGRLNSTTTSLDDLWAWNGTAWTKPVTATTPPSRDSAMLAYDSIRDRVVMFGGFVVAGTDATPLDDTWEFDGVDWLQRTPAHVPPARAYAAFAYDERRGRVVMYGGETLDFMAHVDDTWEWDGTDWIERTPAVIPTARSRASVAYHPLRGTVVMFGGHPAPIDETWEWDGDNWHQLAPTSLAPTRRNGAMAYDALHAQIVMNSGLVSGSVIPGTYALEFRSASSPADACRADVDTDGDGLVGCADPDCAPRCATCGDGMCAAVEHHRICPSDCP